MSIGEKKQIQIHKNAEVQMTGRHVKERNAMESRRCSDRRVNAISGSIPTNIYLPCGTQSDNVEIVEKVCAKRVVL